MALPKLVKVTKPLYIPSLNKDVMFEPFTTEDEKSIITLEPDASAYLKSLVQLNILKKCCQDDTVNFDTMSVVEIAYLFLKLRGISYSGKIDVETTCKKCGEKTTLSININDITLDRELLKPLKFNVNTTDGIYFIIATHYTVDDLQYIGNDFDGEHISMESIALVLRQMMKSDGNDIIDLTQEEKNELFNQLSLDDTHKLIDYIGNNGKMTYHMAFKCPHCGEEYEWDIQDFFI